MESDTFLLMAYLNADHWTFYPLTSTEQCVHSAVPLFNIKSISIFILCFCLPLELLCSYIHFLCHLVFSKCEQFIFSSNSLKKSSTCSGYQQSIEAKALKMKTENGKRLVKCVCDLPDKTVGACKHDKSSLTR